MEQPERRHVVAIKIEADTWDDVLRALTDALYAFGEGGPGVIVSGGWGHNYVILARDKTNPDVTHDSYFAALDEFLAKDSEEGSV